jgi:hypothetical protein
MTPNCERWCSESFLVKEVDTESLNLPVIAAAGLAALDLVEPIKVGRTNNWRSFSRRRKLKESYY